MDVESGMVGSGGERVGRSVGHVGDEDRNLLRGIGGLGEASAFDGGQMLADGVDLGDGRSGVDKRLVGSDEVGERDFIVYEITTGFSTMDEPPPEIIKMTSDAASSAVERFEDGLGGADGFGGWSGMSSAKIAEAANLTSCDCGSTRRRCPSRLLPPAWASRAAAMVWAALPMETTKTRL
jgi:hypothetical protein